MEAGASFVHLQVLLSLVWDSRKKKLQTINWPAKAPNSRG